MLSAIVNSEGTKWWQVHSWYHDGLRANKIGDGEYESVRAGIADSEPGTKVPQQLMVAKPVMVLYTEPANNMYAPHVMTPSGRVPMIVINTGPQPAAFLVHEVETVGGKYKEIVIDTWVDPVEWYESDDNGSRGHIAWQEETFNNMSSAMRNVPAKKLFGENVRRRTAFRFDIHETDNAKIAYTQACFAMKIEWPQEFRTALVAPIDKVVVDGDNTIVYFLGQPNLPRVKAVCGIVDFMIWNRYTARRLDVPPVLCPKLVEYKVLVKFRRKIRELMERKYRPDGAGYEELLQSSTARAMKRAREF